MDIKRIVITLMMIVICSMPAFASYADNFTRDASIKNALVLLEQVGANEVFENLEENSVKIVFYDLSNISYDYMKHFAVNSVDSFGNRYILINSKFKNASPEELACIIAHESFHKLKVATYEEEYLATQKEAYYWELLKDKTKNYNNSELLCRLDNLTSLKIASTEKKNLIQEKINKSSFYKKQLATNSLPSFASLMAK